MYHLTATRGEDLCLFNIAYAPTPSAPTPTPTDCKASTYIYKTIDAIVFILG